MAKSSSELEVFWRPGCPYCESLRDDLAAHGIDATWRDIWQDPKAAQIVREANRGNETVPTVRFGGDTMTNPSAAEVAALIGA